MNVPPLRARLTDLEIEEPGPGGILEGTVFEPRGVRDFALVAGTRIRVEDGSGEVLSTTVSGASGNTRSPACPRAGPSRGRTLRACPP